ncbi:outer membrane protein assembly factor BamB family protein [Natronobacterium texcoconense]|uniref:Outer membrane protein assembly factor BamB, contains PQQ-like beta-propeller repeat n=1 Tax=Natronobacterium texcoconense TaxID=1095778 RepID=A0A1H0YZF7_NATTX|nr:PQQ-binding-like beta-propeller repeat protein [Natronobacterium texcoconense]SDQ20480.1 Outer membrane protein assembly factor BamB, contains PQQ-like beta-propeller repeat [Natronobacterium texcoconense]
MPSRRELLLGVGAASTAAVAGCLGSRTDEPGTDDDYAWTTVGADLRNSRTISDGAAPRDDPDVEWSVDLESGMATGEPIVTDDTVLVNTGRDVVAFDRETRERRWSINPENEPYSYYGSPTVFDDTAYVPERETLTARNLETGEVDWSFDLERIISNSSLTVTDTDDGRVYVAGGNTVHALDAESGEELWEQELLGIASYVIAKYADWLFVATRGGELYRINRWEGRIEWRRTIEAGISSAPIVLTSSDRRVGHGVAVAGGDGSVTYFDLSGKREWRTELHAFGNDGLAIGHRTVFARSGSTLYALDANDGDERWRVDVGRSSRNPPIIVGDTVYVGGDRLRAFDVGGGYGIRSLRIGGKRFERERTGDVNYVTAADGRLFVTTDVGRFEGDDTAELLVFS